jgi:hypothetical protein
MNNRNKLFYSIQGIKGWYPLASANRVVTSEIASDSSEHCVGGLELFVRCGQQDDRRRIIDSAKTFGWLDDNYIDEGNFLDGEFNIKINLLHKIPLLDQKDLGCLLTITIDRIQFPISLATRPGKDRIDDQTSVFVQYRLYDKSTETYFLILYLFIFSANYNKTKKTNC